MIYLAHYTNVHEFINKQCWLWQCSTHLILCAQHSSKLVEAACNCSLPIFNSLLLFFSLFTTTRLWMCSWSRTWCSSAPPSCWTPSRTTVPLKDTCRPVFWRWTSCLHPRWLMLSSATRCSPTMTAPMLLHFARRLDSYRGWVLFCLFPKWQNDNAVHLMGMQ